MPLYRYKGKPIDQTSYGCKFFSAVGSSKVLKKIFVDQKFGNLKELEFKQNFGMRNMWGACRLLTKATLDILKALKWLDIKTILLPCIPTMYRSLRTEQSRRPILVICQTLINLSYVTFFDF